jgi:alkanesulfonate monooxygenase SsuD/methylene tetrahydromethanopterin reductase-like flavin-dependent oxidoreductase (luciferase family)
MQFGIFDHVERKDGVSLADLYRERRAIAVLADQLGCFCYHVSEHHGTPLAMSPSPNMLLAAIAVETKNLRIGPLGALLPLYNPLRLAEEICILDNLSDGRLELGIGRGVSKIEMKFYNVDVAESRAMFEEALEVILRALTQETLDYSGQYYDFDMVPMEIKSVQQPTPPIWYPTSNLQSVPWVAKNGYNTIFAGELDHIAESVSIFKENLDPSLVGTVKYGIHPFIVVAPTDAEALEIARVSYQKHHDNLSYLRSWQGRTTSMTRVQNLKAPATVDEAVELGWAAVGSPATVREQLGATLDKTGCNYVLFTPNVADTPLPIAKRTLELFATQVIPELP